MLVLTHKGEFTKSIYNRVNLVEPGVLSKKKKKNIVDIGVEWTVTIVKPPSHNVRVYHERKLTQNKKESMKLNKHYFQRWHVLLTWRWTKYDRPVSKNNTIFNNVIQNLHLDKQITGQPSFNFGSSADINQWGWISAPKEQFNQIYILYSSLLQHSQLVFGLEPSKLDWNSLCFSQITFTIVLVWFRLDDLSSHQCFPLIGKYTTHFFFFLISR